MPNKYFDVNGATPGFTNTVLSGVWDGTTANWSTDPSGSVTTGLYTVSDSAFFGSPTGPVTAAGSVQQSATASTIGTGVYVYNIAGTQKIVQGLYSTIRLNSSSPYFVDTGSHLEIALSIVNYLEKQGGGKLSLSGGSNSGTGWLVTAGELEILPSIAGFPALGGVGGVTVLSGATLTLQAPWSRTGAFTVNSGGTLTMNEAVTLQRPVIAAGATATINASPSVGITYSGNGVTFGVSPISIGGSVIIGNTASTLTRSVLPANMSLTGAANVSAGAAAGAYTTIIQRGATLGGTTSTGYSGHHFGETGSTASSFAHYRGETGTLTQGSSIAFGVDGSATADILATMTGTILGANSVLIGSGGSTSVSAGGSTGHAVVNVFGKTIQQTSSGTGGFIIGGNLFTSGGYQKVLTLESASALVAGTRLTFRGSSVAAGALLAVNLKDSSATVATVVNELAGTPIRFNMENATLVLNGTSAAAIPYYLYGTTNKNVFSSTGTGVVLGQILRPTGNGVTSITFTPGTGTSYEGAPVIVITPAVGDTTGGGATARAVWDPDTKAVTSIVVTNPGTGYTAAPTVTVGAGTNSGAVALGGLTASIGPNSDDIGVKKGGAGTVAFAATNTFVGDLEVNEGTASIGNGGTTGTLGDGDASNAVIASGATLNFNRGATSPSTDSRTYASLLSGNGGISKTGGTQGTAILTANNAFLGSVTIGASGGALRAKHSNALGLGAGVVTVSGTGGALELEESALGAGITLSRGVTFSGTGINSGGAVRSVGGNNTITGPLTAAAAFALGAASNSTLTLSNTGNVSLSATITASFVGDGDVNIASRLIGTGGTVTKSAGTGCAILNNATNSYTGVTTITTGRVGYVGDVAPSANSSFGLASAATSLLIKSGAGIRYYGTDARTFSRPYRLDGTTGTTNWLESNGTGSINHNLAPSYEASGINKTIGLGGTGIGANAISFLVGNNVAGLVTITKADSGKWRLTNTGNSYTGGTNVNGGTLVLEVATWSAGSSVTNATTGGTVTVGNGGTIQLPSGTGDDAQRGRHTYKNLTFSAGSRIQLGG